MATLFHHAVQRNLGQGCQFCTAHKPLSFILVYKTKQKTLKPLLGRVNHNAQPCASDPQAGLETLTFKPMQALLSGQDALKLSSMHYNTAQCISHMVVLVSLSSLFCPVSVYMGTSVCVVRVCMCVTVCICVCESH